MRVSKVCRISFWGEKRKQEEWFHRFRLECKWIILKQECIVREQSISLYVYLFMPHSCCLQKIPLCPDFWANVWIKMQILLRENQLPAGLYPTQAHPSSHLLSLLVEATLEVTRIRKWEEFWNQISRMYLPSNITSCFLRKQQSGDGREPGITAQGWG